ncbi:MAG: sodium:proton antiporter [Methanomicrobiaceae archaeon]|nr:sodium:proton antiporter [Methanomicrobiaceae archaeon]
MGILFEAPVVYTEIIIILILFLVSVSAVALKKLNFPYTVGLVIIGMAAGFLAGFFEISGSVSGFTVSPYIIFYVFLPPLVFRSAFKIDKRVILKTIRPILLLAVPGLIISAFIIGIIADAATPLNLAAALIFGALISATDPVAVISLFKELGVSRRLTMLVEGESLFNDASAIVMFNLFLAVWFIGINPFGYIASNLSQFIIDILLSFGGGILTGLTIGAVLVLMMSYIRNNPLVQATLSIIIAYSAFIVSEIYLHVSGVIAVVSAGLVFGWFVQNQIKRDESKRLEEFWDFAGFITNSMLFFLVGITAYGFFGNFNFDKLFFAGLLVVIMTVFFARAVVVFGLIPLSNMFGKKGSRPVGLKDMTVIFWGGLRGAVALALALSIPLDFEFRDLIISYTLAVALVTIIISGGTMKWLTTRIGLEKISFMDKIMELFARLEAKSEGKKMLLSVGPEAGISDEILTSCIEDYDQEIINTKKSISSLWREHGKDLTSERKIVWLYSLSIEHQAYHDLYEQGFITEPVFSQIEHIIDSKYDDILSGAIPPEWPGHDSAMISLYNGISGILDRFLPDMIISRHFRRNRLTLQYDFEAAIMIVSAHVSGKVSEISGDLQVESTAAEECIKYYNERRDVSLKYIEEYNRLYPDLSLLVQDYFAGMTSLSGEALAVERLARGGEINEKMLFMLKEEIEKKRRDALLKLTG